MYRSIVVILSYIVSVSNQPSQIEILRIIFTCRLWSYYSTFFKVILVLVAMALSTWKFKNIPIISLLFLEIQEYPHHSTIICLMVEQPIL